MGKSFKKHSDYDDSHNGKAKNKNSVKGKRIKDKNALKQGKFYMFENNFEKF